MTGEKTMENYIVKIYRDEKDHPRSIIGIVEAVGTEGKQSFTNVDELWHILNPRKKGGRWRQEDKDGAEIE
jgi:hypothetical protein